MGLTPIPAAWALAVALTLAGGPAVVGYLRRAHLAQVIRDDAPGRHREKAGTPTMGGVLIIGAAVVAALAAAVLGRAWSTELAVGLAVIALFAAIGGVDDALGIARGRNLGLRAREKLALQVPAALLLGVYVARAPELGSAVSVWGTPARVDLGWLYPVLCMILVVGMANAVNLTDGLDGLAAGSVAIAAAALAVLTGRVGAVSVGVIAAAVSGAALGFLWFNAHPARVFMGDVGSQGLGAALAVTGVLAKLEIAMLIVGGLFVVEALSVIAQVTYFRLTGGRRLLRMSPLHHHYELGGWTETQTVVRFWLCGALLAVLGMGLTS